MSGDVQPRKRKDKKRKREDDESSHGVHITKMGNEDVHLHVQHDHGTGGHWCAKLFFFSLLTILLGLIALIILENRGLADLDTPLAESRFSNYFDGWVDESHDDHEHAEHDAVKSSIEEHEEHDEPFEEEEDHGSDLDEDHHDEHDEDEDEEEEEKADVDEDEDDDQLTDDEDDDVDEQTEGTEEATKEQVDADDDDDDGDDGDENATKETANDDDNNDDDEDEDDTRGEDDNNTGENINDNDDDNEDDGEDDGEDAGASTDKTAEASLKNNKEELDDDDDDEDADDNDNADDNNDGDDDADEEAFSSIFASSAQKAPASQPASVNNDADDTNDNDDDDIFDEEDDEGTFESLEPVVDNDAEELLLLQKKAREQAAQAAQDLPASPEEDEFDAAEAAPSWVSSQIKPKERVGGGPQAQSDYDMFEHELRKANEEMMRENYNVALQALDQLIRKYPDRAPAFLAQAQLLDKLSEQRRSNELLTQALDAYKRYLAFGNLILNSNEFRTAAERCIERMRFMGYNQQAVTIHELLIERHADEPHFRNQLAVTYLLLNRLPAAKQQLAEVLRRWPQDGFAQVHYGFVLAQHDKDYAAAAVYLQQGIDSNVAGTQDGRFYFTLGDALQRLQRTEQARAIYVRGAKLQLFPSALQRSLYNEPQLRAQPFWTKRETTYAANLLRLEQNWRAIRDEGLRALSKQGYFLDETESLRASGDWKQFELYARGQRRSAHCQRAPVTCGLIDQFYAASGCRRGQVKFSVMHPGTHIWPHCGPTNCRLRAHLGLVVPAGATLRVANANKTWTEGEFIVFDDSFEHEVWHNGEGLRLVLIVDVWHPDLSLEQRQSLSAI